MSQIKVGKLWICQCNLPKLLDFLIKASDSPAAHEREVVIFTLYTLMNIVVGTFAENLPQIYNLFAKALQDPESLEVRATTVQALGRVSEFMKADKKSSIKDPVGQQPDQTTGSRSDRVGLLCTKVLVRLSGEGSRLEGRVPAKGIAAQSAKLAPGAEFVLRVNFGLVKMSALTLDSP
ncbi:hypothetical protein PPACK8108_LOCUS2459 [Phakopsora pachyrhizi]|uniref:IPO4/5-like TPR repeats domain-containing protein n=1 Tax=Phakopsora pachyrhizi TaxID=170000 RepID=A0AAV0AKX8_PHAPC|nr:hypothetical protein PPACK8108_LOCUS2459 [Phakopsora pachyrhizi]